jgi:hypothetical protein
MSPRVRALTFRLVTWQRMSFSDPASTKQRNSGPK